MNDSQPTWTGRTIGGRYVIQSLLGRGGMSSVYKATDPNLQRTVAVKIIHPHLSEQPEFVKRFEQEAAAVAKLRHPNIMLVHDFNHDGSAYYIVFEYIAGEPLDQRLKSLKEAGLRLPIEESIRIMTPLCEAVAYAHERNMIHRDLKPSNVIINLLGQPILLDFGIAKIVGGDHVHTATGATIGTAAYMAPEQVMGEGVNHRADIYSLGIMLYEMVCGRPPFEGNSALTVMMKHVNEPVPDVRVFNANVPEIFSAVFERALAKDPKNRYGSAIEMATALREIGRQVSADSATEAFTTPITPAPTPATEQQAASTPPAVAEPVPPEQTSSQPQAEPEPTIAETPAAPTATQSRSRLAWIVGGVLLLATLVAGAIFFLPGLLESGPPPSTGMIQIPAGTYTVGFDGSGSQYAAVQEVILEPFWIDRYEVTNAEYAAYLEDTGESPPAGWNGNAPPAGESNHPVKGLTWATANDYCQWAGKRLPTEAEWEVAARGEQTLLYPWSDSLNDVLLPADNTYPVGAVPANRSSFGAFDMAGNVWEWVDAPYAAVPEGQRVARGGAYDFMKDLAYRLQGNPDLPTMIATTGVRCAASEVEIVPDDEIIVQDEFTDPASGWPEVREETAWRGYHPPDYYHVEATGANQIGTSYFGGTAKDIGIQARIFVDIVETEEGNFRYGLVLRREGLQFYAFTVSPRAQRWYALKGTSDGLETLAEGEITTLTGWSVEEADTLRVDASSSEFAFFVNGRIVTTITDSDYAEGDFGFFVQTFDETRAHVHYDSLLVQTISGEPIVGTGASVAVNTEEAVETTAPEAAETEEAEVETAESTTAATEPDAPTNTPRAPTATPEPEPTPTPTEPAAPEGMVLVPGGTFLMGSEDGEPNERPEHEVTLTAYFIDRFEVNNAQYRACVEDGGCTQANLRNSFRRAGYRDDPTFDNYPVMGVTWNQAQAYCEWAGKRLPTEAEWEFAARGPDNFTWPWGNEFDPNLSAASALDLEPVDNYEEGVSPFGVYNMAGNVNEWILDVYDPNFYANSPVENPLNSEGGNQRIYRGGSFDNPNGAFFTTSRRYVRPASTFDVDIGFRCTMDLP